MRTVSCLAIAVAAPAFLAAQQSLSTQPHEQGSVTTEQLVQARAEDGILNGGALFMPRRDSTKPIAVIWIHGTGVNFYYPTYVKIGRELAARGFATIIGNTRMHDLGNVAGFRGETRIRGGSYWGVTSQQVRDVAAWIEFANQRGFDRVILVGHSAGTTAVQMFQAQRQDKHVAGLVLASGRFRPSATPTDSVRLKQAARLVAEGRGQEVPQNPDASRQYFTSAATLLDLANMGLMLTDFFGVHTEDPPVARIRCPLLAWFGTREADVGTAADLELLEATLKRLSAGPSHVTTVMIQNADHMYSGEEGQVAQTIAKWVDDVVARQRGTDPRNN